MTWAHLAETVIRHRKRRGWWQRDLAQRSGMSVRTVRRLESGREPVSETALFAIEAALGWQHGSAQRVLTGGRPTLEVDDDLAAVIERWSRLDARARAAVRAAVEQLAD